MRFWDAILIQSLWPASCGVKLFPSLFSALLWYCIFILFSTGLKHPFYRIKNSLSITVSFCFFTLCFCFPSPDFKAPTFCCSIFLLCPYVLFQILLLFRGEIRRPGRGVSLSCASMSTHLFLSLTDLCNAFGLPFYSSLLTFPAHRFLRSDAFSVSFCFFSLCFCFPSPDFKASTFCKAEHCFTFLPFLCSFGTAFCCLIYPRSPISDSDALCDRARGARCLAAFPLC